MNSTTFQEVDPASQPVRPSHRSRWLIPAAALLIALLLLAGLTYGGYRYLMRERHGLRALREAVSAAAAPGETIVVDDPLLGWALRRGRSAATVRPNILIVNPRIPVSELASRLPSGHRELVLVTTPTGPLIHSLDAAGFSVAQEVGWVPWDVDGKGRGRLEGKRIFFVVEPKP